MPKIFDIKQGTDEWFDARRGVITATRAADLLARNKNGKYSESRQTMICEIAMERLGGMGRDPIVGGATLKRGKDYEDDAAIAYECATLRSTQLCGFMIHDDYPQFGCSPDRLVGDRGLLETKVPTCIKKMTSYLLESAHLTEYDIQIRHQLFVSGRDWVDICAYDNRAPGPLQTAIDRLERPDSWGSYIAEIMKADREIGSMVLRLQERGECA